MREYKPKSKGEIKTEVNRHIRDVGDYTKRGHDAAKDIGRISNLYKQIRDSRITLDGKLQIDKAMQDASGTAGKHCEKVSHDLEARVKDAYQTVSGLRARTKDAKANAEKAGKVAREITTSDARTDMAKAEGAARKDAQFTNTEYKRLEERIEHSKESTRAQRGMLYNPLSQVPDYQMEHEVGRAVQEVRNEGSVNQEQHPASDNKKRTGSKDETEIEKAIENKKDGGKSERIRKLKKALADAEMKKERLMRGQRRRTKPHTVEQQDNQNKPAYDPPLGDIYKQDKG